MSVVYEWIVEGIDEHGDIQEVDHFESLEMALSAASDTGYIVARVCLVRDSGHRLQDRVWAYVDGRNVPETFSDSGGADTGIKVPKKFRA